VRFINEFKKVGNAGEYSFVKFWWYREFKLRPNILDGAFLGSPVT
jgi:hypothetical protein